MVIIIVTVSKGEKKIGLITAKKIISTSMEQISGCADVRFQPKLIVEP